MAAQRSRLVAALVDQVDEYRQGDQRQTQQHDRLQEAHRKPRVRVRPTRNRISTFS